MSFNWNFHVNTFQLIKEAQLNSSISSAFTSLLLVNQSKDDRHQYVFLM